MVAARTTTDAFTTEQRYQRLKSDLHLEMVGMIDVSTLGGLDIRGPDAAEFVDRMYTWAYAKQPVGQARYALTTMCIGVGQGIAMVIERV